jgi:TonB family protein
MNGELTRLLVTLLLFPVAVAGFPNQNATSASIQESVVLTKLFQPVYPPLAKQIRIAGDVELTLEVRQDGSLESAAAISGHPLLEQAALDSARRSRFECNNCGQGVRSILMLYSFQLGPTSYCTGASDMPISSEKQEPYPRVIQSQNHITVVDQPVGTCDLAIERRKVRSIKCLYLWKCGLQ